MVRPKQGSFILTTLDGCTHYMSLHRTQVLPDINIIHTVLEEVTKGDPGQTPQRRSNAETKALPFRLSPYCRSCH